MRENKERLQQTGTERKGTEKLQQPLREKETAREDVSLDEGLQKDRKPEELKPKIQEPSRSTDKDQRL